MAACTIRLECVPDLLIQQHRRLPACHREIDVGQQLGVDQRAVNIALGRIDLIALAQRVQAVALPRVHLARHRQRVEHRAVVLDLRLAVLHELELMLEKADVERRRCE